MQCELRLVNAPKTRYCSKCLLGDKMVADTLDRKFSCNVNPASRS